MIGDHDYDVKLKAACRFLEGGDKVKSCFALSWS